jgi:hypothetical protein
MDVEFQKYNMLRSPSWRWERVLELTEGDRPRRVSFRRDDHYVREAKQFHVDYTRMDPSERHGLFLDNPGLYYAYELKMQEDEYIECALQARLLAGQTYQEIADAVGALPSAIEWYEALFFNVADRVGDKTKYRDWVIRQVIGPAAMRGIADREFDVTAKLFAYFAGVEAMEVVTHYFKDFKRPSSPEDMGRFLDDVMAHNVRRRSAMVSATFDVNKFNVMQLFEIHTKLSELEITKQGMAGPVGDFERSVSVLLGEVEERWCVGSEAKEMWKDNPLGQFQGLPTELRAEEAMMVAAGKHDPELLQEVSQLRLPPPRRTTNEDAK